MLLDINTAVAEAIRSSNPVVVQTVKSRLIAKEVDRRVDALVKAIDEATKLEKEVQKIKPDSVIYNEDKSVQSTGWTKAKLEEREKAEKKLAKLRQSIDKALEQSDYSQLLNPQKDEPQPS